MFKKKVEITAIMATEGVRMDMFVGWITMSRITGIEFVGSKKRAIR